MVANILCNDWTLKLVMFGIFMYVLPNITISSSAAFFMLTGVSISRHEEAESRFVITLSSFLSVTFDSRCTSLIFALKRFNKVQYIDKPKQRAKYISSVYILGKNQVTHRYLWFLRKYMVRDSANRIEIRKESRTAEPFKVGVLVKLGQKNFFFKLSIVLK